MEWVLVWEEIGDEHNSEKLNYVNQILNQAKCN